jgi:TolB-like protein/cytochrome c-type biogenesis protein CcmH/NrfG
MPSVRRLTAILAADIAGYSRLMGADEEGTHERVRAHLRELVDPKIREHRGRTVKNTGDGFLAEFPSVVDAVRCAVEVQRGMIDRELEVTDERRITFRIGINLGDVIVEEHDIFGDGVNIAARLEALAEPGGVCVSRTVRDHIRNKLPYPFEDLGEQSVKNIARPVRVYALSAAAVALLPPSVATAEAGKPVASSTSPRLSIVVLPFANMSNDPEQEYFADGITDDLTTDLSRISGSFVIARNTAFTYKGKSVDVKQVGRELGVRYVLEGSVRRVGDQVRVNVQLVDGESGAHLWGDRFDTDRANLAQAQDEITGRLARTLNLELAVASVRQIEQERAVDPDARDLVMRGWVLYNRMASAATREEAQRAFERALEIDPESVDARIGLGEVLVSADPAGGSSSFLQNITRAEQLVFEALERDPKRSRAHFAMGLIRRRQGRLPDSKIELEAAIALDPNQASGHRQLGITLMFLGQPEAAIPQLEKSTRLSPHDPFIALNYHALGTCHLFLGQVDEAIDLLRRARATSPRYYFVHLNLAAALGLRADLNEARAALAEGVKLKPELNSLARFSAFRRSSNNPEYLRLREKTIEVGLRKAGMPEE